MKQDTLNFIEKYNLKLNTTTGLYDSTCSIKIDRFILESAKLPIKFGFVNGSFDCSDCDLKSLEGVPTRINGNFNCNNTFIKTLEFAPKNGVKNFSCVNCNLLTLSGAPVQIEGDFICSSNFLSNLVGAPKTGVKNFKCIDNRLKSLAGCPVEIDGSFNCSYNNSLASLEFSPQWGVTSFSCRKCGLTSMEHAPFGASIKFSYDENPKLQIDCVSVEDIVRALTSREETFCELYSKLLKDIESKPAIGSTKYLAAS